MLLLHVRVLHLILLLLLLLLLLLKVKRVGMQRKPRSVRRRWRGEWEGSSGVERGWRRCCR
jgi:hypothetical protein